MSNMTSSHPSPKSGLATPPAPPPLQDDLPGAACVSVHIRSSARCCVCVPNPGEMPCFPPRKASPSLPSSPRGIFPSGSRRAAPAFPWTDTDLKGWHELLPPRQDEIPPIGVCASFQALGNYPR